MESDPICEIIRETPPEGEVLEGHNEKELQTSDGADMETVQSLIKSEPLEDLCEVGVSNTKAESLLNNGGGFEFVAMEHIKQEAECAGCAAEETDMLQATPSQSLGTETLCSGELEMVSSEEPVRGGVLSCSNCERTFSIAENFEKHQSRCRKRRNASQADGQSVKDTSSGPKSSTRKVKMKRKGLEARKRIEKGGSRVKKLAGKKVKARKAANVEKNQRNKATVHEIPVKVMSKEKIFECDVCQKRFPRRTNLIQHTIVHTGDRRFKCDVCGKRFSQSAHLTRHGRMHTGEKPYECETCGSRFNELSHLAVHGRKHTGEKPYECDTCHKRYRHYSSLVGHRRVHTGERPYHCDACGKWFGQSSDLTRHNRVHTGDKPYHCEVCGARFTQSSVLTTHLRRHTGERPFQCEFCPKGFKDSSSLTTHRRTHTREKPFSCGVCGKRFADSSSLTKHGRTHTGEKPFACSACDKRYSHCSQLIRHRKKHHETDDSFGEHSVSSLLVSYT